MKPLISIIIPVYKVEMYLEQCIRSIVNQTYQNLEIILVDDGSPDNSPFICDSWASKDNRIKVIHQPNGGVSSARNLGLEIAKGDFIGFVDSDDWIEPNMYQTMINLAMENKADVVFVSYYNVYEQNKIQKVNPDMIGVVNREDAMIAAIRGKYFVSIWNKLFKSNICKNISTGATIRFKDYSWGEDEAWLFDVLNNCSSAYLCNIPLYYWRVRQGSASRKIGLTQDKLNLLYIEGYVYEIAKNVGVKVANIAATNQFINIYNLLVEAYISDNKKALGLLKSQLKTVQRIWLRSNESMLGKCKKLIVVAIIFLHFPKKIIKYVNGRGGN